MHRSARAALLFLVAFVGVAWPLAHADDPDATPRWWKGNTHTHTLWSDGEAAPEVVASWYKEHGYHFLVLSDHNILSVGEKWVDVGPKERVSPAELESLRSQFPGPWVVTRVQDAKTSLRLKTLLELREAFEEPGRFLFLQGEEVTDRFEKKPVHLNAVNIEEAIPPQGGESVREVIERTLAAARAEATRTGRPTLVHLNHPNFKWGIAPDDIAYALEERFFEVYNGHPAVANEGDGNHLGTEAIWDYCLALRLGKLGGEPLFGLATDDAHHYFQTSKTRANPGRGWIHVRSGSLDEDAITQALLEGDFYASTGVVLEDVSSDRHELVVRIDAQTGASYTTRFIGTRVVGEELGEVGALLAETTDPVARYPFVGDELYVRAVVSSDRPHENGYLAGEVERAWIQPVVAKTLPRHR